MPGYARLGLLAALTLAAATVLTGAQPPAAPRPASVAAGPAPADSFQSARTYPTIAAPVRLRIRALRIDSRLQRLGLRNDGTVAVPRRTDVAGWYEQGPRPGQAGPAVMCQVPDL